MTKPMHDHPDPDLLNAFAEGALTTRERDRTLAHLAVCAHCRLIVQLALPPFELPAEPIREAARMRRWFAGWRLAWAAGASFAALGLFSLLVTRHAPPPPAVPVQVARNAMPPNQPSPAIDATPAIVPRTPRVTAPAPPSPAQLDRLEPTPAPSIQAQARLSPPILPPSHPPAALPTGTVASVAKAAAPALAARAAAPAPAAAQTTTVDASSGAAANIATDNSSVNFASVIDAQNISALPTRPVLSTYTQGKQTLGIDSSGRLFLSADGGRHYKPVKAVWSGKAVRIGAPRSEPEPAPAILARNTKPGPAGTLSGDITDATGASIPGATVAISAPGSAPVQTVKSDGNGHFQTRALPPGPYQVEAIFPGFETLRAQVQVAQAEAPPLRLTLQTGAVSETVEVSAATPEISGRARKIKAPIFELTTDTGAHWTSVDGKHWQPAQK